MFEPPASGSEWLATAFAATNALRALFYVPQVAAVLRSVDGARDIALSTWWMWTANNVLGALYTGSVMNHAALAWSFWASATACVLTIGLTIRARRLFFRDGGARRSDEAHPERPEQPAGNRQPAAAYPGSRAGSARGAASLGGRTGPSNTS